MKIQCSKKKQKGFTLIELVVVIVVLGILAATAVPRFANISTDARDAVCQGVLGSLTSAAAIELAANNGVAQTRVSVIAATIITGGNPVPTAAASVTAGVIDVDVGATTCSTADLLAAGLTSD
jgi:prepilin-type N-terminal cleavage/methylation domain-containing protein